MSLSNTEPNLNNWMITSNENFCLPPFRKKQKIVSDKGRDQIDKKFLHQVE
jgi:hypothetical protein